MTRVIGIDLGTSYTVTAALEQGRPNTIPNSEGELLTPSVVAFSDDGEALVGRRAKAEALGGRAAVFSIKRHMGSDYRAVAGGREYTPEQVSSLILRKAKRDAETYFDARVESAVITVPAYFNDRQRQATREAAALAGLSALRIINEPTAAALAYGLEREDVQLVMVWDLGGGTFDVSVLELGDGVFEVKAVGGDTWLGGDDFDRRILDWVTGQLSQGERMKALSSAPPAALREAAENAKIALSSAAATRIFVPGLAPSGASLLLTRERLEQLAAGLLQRMERCARQALADAGLVPAEVERVLLVGGATRMPAVRALVKRMMGREPYRYIDPDLVVAAGAAIHAGMLTGEIERAALLDVLPLSLGVETQGGLASRIIARNTPLPARGTCIFTTADDYQSSMNLHVLQGERAMAVDNVSLGEFQLDGIPPLARGLAKVEVVFEADVDGIVHVSARDLLSENGVQIELAGAKALDKGEIARLAEEAARHGALDGAKRRRAEATVRANSALAAAELAVRALAGQPEKNRRLGIQYRAARLSEALAAGISGDIEAEAEALRALLVDSEREAEGRPAAVAVSREATER